MPNCFQLYRKGGSEPIAFQTIDEAMCQHFGYHTDPVKYHHGWYDYIGFALAMGKDFAWVIAKCDEYAVEDKAPEYWGHMKEIAQWLSENFTSSAWVEIGGRR